MATSKTQRMAQKLIERHPMQRLPSPSRGVSALLHLLGCASFAYSFNFLIQNPNKMSVFTLTSVDGASSSAPRHNTSYGWHFQYLTIVGLTLAAVTFVVALLADLTLSRRVFFFKNALLIVSAPIEVLISILYWGLSAIDTALVVPPDMPRPPFMADLSFHAVPAIVLAVDLLFFSPPWTISAGPMMAISSLVAVGYWFWTERNYKYNGFYPYPIFDVEPTHRMGIFVGAALVSFGSAMTLRWIYHAVNGSLLNRSQERVGKLK